MGGRLAPVLEGEMDGLKKGISTGFAVWEMARDFKSDDTVVNRDITYHIGLGVGFARGQVYRKKLKEFDTNLSFESKAELLAAKVNHYRISSIYQELDEFIQSQSRWDSKMIPQDICDISRHMISHGRLNMGISTVQKFYERDKRLKTMFDFSTFPNRLAKIRSRKRDGEIDETQSKDLRMTLQNDFLEWVSQNEA